MEPVNSNLRVFKTIFSIYVTARISAQMEFFSRERFFLSQKIINFLATVDQSDLFSIIHGT